MLRKKGPTPEQLAAAAKPMNRLEERREELRARFTEMQWDLGGAAYEMAARDYFRLDVLAGMAARLQIVDAELAEIERMARLENAGAEGSCAGCGSLHARGAIYCWRCGRNLFDAPARPALVAAPNPAPVAPVLATPEVVGPEVATPEQTLPEEPVLVEEPVLAATPVEPAWTEAPVEPVEPVLQEAAVAPVEPVEPVEPAWTEAEVAPVEPVEPAWTEAPVEPVEPVSQEPAVAPVEPVEPAWTEAEVASVEPVLPEAAVGPVDPAVPEGSFVRPWAGASSSEQVATPGPVTVPPFEGAVEVPTYERPSQSPVGPGPNPGDA